MNSFNLKTRARTDFIHIDHEVAQAGRLQRGTWQSLFFCEFDAPRTRKVWLKGISTT